MIYDVTRSTLTVSATEYDRQQKERELRRIAKRMDILLLETLRKTADK